MEVDTTTDGQAGYSGKSVCRIVGITYRQLDYWARTDLLRPSVRDAAGSGTQRAYSFTDILQLKVIKRFLDTGVSLQRIRSAIEYLRTELSPGSSLTDVTLVADGGAIYLCRSDAELIDLVRRGQGVFSLALGTIDTELRGELKPLDEARARAAAHTGAAEPPLAGAAGTPPSEVAGR